MWCNALEEFVQLVVGFYSLINDKNHFSWSLWDKPKKRTETDAIYFKMKALKYENKGEKGCLHFLDFGFVLWKIIFNLLGNMFSTE